MSNCHVVAGRSLIDLVASRLALRAPALRAATALTRPNQSAQWLPCGRHTAEAPHAHLWKNLYVSGARSQIKVVRGAGRPPCRVIQAFTSDG